MNLIDAVVTKVYGEPVKLYNKWWVPCEYVSFGHTGTTRLMFESKEDAEAVKEGFRFVT